MNTKQIWQALSQNEITYEYFNGVFPKDSLSYIKDKPKLIICNTDPSYKSGEHWIAFFFDESDGVDFFDSLGRKMDYYGNDFVNFASQFASKYNWSTVRTQPKGSNLCGQYCLFFAYKRCKGEKLESIITSMESSEDVIKFVNDKFKICQSDSCLFQCCTDL